MKDKCIYSDPIRAHIHVLCQNQEGKWLNSYNFHALLNTTPLKVMMYANEHGLLILASP